MIRQLVQWLKKRLDFPARVSPGPHHWAMYIWGSTVSETGINESCLS
jgi:hypothetical protein